MLRSARDYLSLTKPRITLTVLLTTFVGYWLAASGRLEVGRLTWTLVGTGLTVAGAAALNCYQEVEADRRMERTRHRPLPAGRLAPGRALAFGLGTGTLGLLGLWWGVNLPSAGLALLALLVYTPIYTLLKSRTSLATLVGAIPGALPPAIGWVAATGRIDPPALVLCAIMFVWQPPHFLALALFRESDYERADLAMLPVELGRRASLRQIVIYTSMLLPLTLVPPWLNMAGGWYSLGALLLGVGFLGGSLSGLWWDPARLEGWARGLFSYSIFYLTALFGLLLLDPMG